MFSLRPDLEHLETRFADVEVFRFVAQNLEISRFIFPSLVGNPQLTIGKLDFLHTNQAIGSHLIDSGNAFQKV